MHVFAQRNLSCHPAIWALIVIVAHGSGSLLGPRPVVPVQWIRTPQPSRSVGGLGGKDKVKEMEIEIEIEMESMEMEMEMDSFEGCEVIIQIGTI
jgi:hypothetical protein